MNKTTTLLATIGLALSGAAQAEGDSWIFRIGVHDVSPKSDNHSVVNVDPGQALSFNLTRMFDEHWGVEVLAALPFKHDVNLNGGGRVADVKHLPPTVSVQYHFAPHARFRPYVGAGLNATLFFDESTTGALAGQKLSLDTSFGAAAQLGFDYQLTDMWFVNADLRWIDIDTKAKLDGASIGEVAIDPLTFGVTFGLRF